MDPQGCIFSPLLVCICGNLALLLELPHRQSSELPVPQLHRGDHPADQEKVTVCIWTFGRGRTIWLPRLIIEASLYFAWLITQPGMMLKPSYVQEYCERRCFWVTTTTTTASSGRSPCRSREGNSLYIPTSGGGGQSDYWDWLSKYL